MRSFATIVSLLLAYCTAVYATALTYRLDAHEKACFFANVEHKGTKVAFYFAVQSGGSFDIDYSVVGPSPTPGGQEKVILDGTKERQGDFVFTANEVGEYRFCFNNEMSTFAEKLVDFEIAVRTPDLQCTLQCSPHKPSQISDTDTLRSKTKPPAPPSPQNKGPPPNKPLSSRNPSSSCPHSCPPSPATRSTSVRVRTATSAPSRAPRSASSTSA